MKCFAKLDCEGNDRLENVKVTVKDIKNRIGDSNYFRPINTMLSVRNDIGHGDSADSVKKVLALLDKSMFYEVLRLFDLDSELVSNIKEVHRLFNSKDSLKRDCLKYCKDEVLSSRGKGVRLVEILNSAYTLYLKCIVDECMLGILGNEYFV